MARLLLILALTAVPMKWVYAVDKGKCNGCGNCIYGCSEGAISIVGGDAWIDPELCTGCGTCVYFCPRDAIYRVWYTGIEEESISGEGLRLLTNPVAGGSVSLAGAEPDQEVVLMDAAGRTIGKDLADSDGNADFDVSGLPRGSYRISSGSEMVVLSVI